MIEQLSHKVEFRKGLLKLAVFPKFHVQKDGCQPLKRKKRSFYQKLKGTKHIEKNGR